MTTEFEKMHVCGNDFMVVDAITTPFTSDLSLIQAWGDRRKGIGFDQLLILEPPQKSYEDLFMRIHNCDGSEASQCGNGCAAAVSFARRRELMNKASVRIGTKSGPVRCDMTAYSVDMVRPPHVTVEFRPPDLDPKNVPFLAEETRLRYCVEIPSSEQELEIMVLSMGNPHAVILVDDIDATDLENIGRELQNHVRFPDSVNVEILHCINRTRGQLRIYERGVGETLACGSGACAAMVAGRLLNRFDPSITIAMPGGEVKVQWTGHPNPVRLTCQAVSVYSGTLATST